MNAEETTIAVLFFVSFGGLAAMRLHARYRKHFPKALYEEPRSNVDRGVQIAGEPCVACDSNILVESEGMECRQCSSPVHRKCHQHHRSACLRAKSRQRAAERELRV